MGELEMGKLKIDRLYFPDRHSISSNPDFSLRHWKGGASQAAEKPCNAVILSSCAVILSAAKNLALSIFKAGEILRRLWLLRMTVPPSFSAACSAAPFQHCPNVVRSTG
jgi:hypothetical protein